MKFFQEKYVGKSHSAEKFELRGMAVSSSHQCRKTRFLTTLAQFRLALRPEKLFDILFTFSGFMFRAKTDTLLSMLMLK